MGRRARAGRRRAQNVHAAFAALRGRRAHTSLRVAFAPNTPPPLAMYPGYGEISYDELCYLSVAPIAVAVAAAALPVSVAAPIAVAVVVAAAAAVVVVVAAAAVVVVVVVAADVAAAEVDAL